ncbi:MAG TPA: aminotransferase class V-fold PLP-dependent enzyme, partial [Steroidobacteraceae bacterium]|nr:aminotransferase class V-fold PLP-dependent enzyme [Steroidobacteraceae bacterium]
TENVAGIAGAAEALRITQEEVLSESGRIRALALRLREAILARVPGAELNGDPDARLANNVSISFVGADARDLVDGLDAAGIACSAGAACGATTVEPSHVLLAMGLPLERAVSTLRFSLGHETTDADIAAVADRLPAIVASSREARLVAAGG